MAPTPESVIRAWFEEVWNKGDDTVIDRLLHTEALMHGLPTPAGRPLRGPDEFKPFYHAFRGAFPDVAVELLHVISDGDMTVAHCRVTGTHQGNTLGIPATNRRVEIGGMALGRISEGQLVEGWSYFDFMGMYEQLGVPHGV